MAASALTDSVDSMLAATVNALSDGADISASSLNTAALIGALYNTTTSGSGTPHKTMTIPAMLAGIRNALSGAADVSASSVSLDALMAQIANELTGTTGYSALTHSFSQLLAAACTAAEEGGGGSEPLEFPPTDYTASGDAVVTVLQSPHVDDGISCWQIEITADAENSCVLALPDEVTGVPAAFGQTWKLEAWVRQDALTAGIDSFGLALAADTGGIGSDGTPPTVGGALSASYRQFQGVINAGHEAATLVYGQFSITLVGPGSITLTLAFRLSQVS